MIKILKQGNTLRQVGCWHCFSMLKYDCIQDTFCDDIKYNEKLKCSVYSWYIKCPKCGCRIKVEERPTRGQKKEGD